MHSDSGFTIFFLKYLQLYGIDARDGASLQYLFTLKFFEKRKFALQYIFFNWYVGVTGRKTQSVWDMCTEGVSEGEV